MEQLEQQEAAAIAAAAADGTLPPSALPPRRHTAGVISPRLGSPAYWASKGFSSGSSRSIAEGFYGGKEAEGEGLPARGTGKVGLWRSIFLACFLWGGAAGGDSAHIRWWFLMFLTSGTIQQYHTRGAFVLLWYYEIQVLYCKVFIEQNRNMRQDVANWCRYGNFVCSTEN